MGGQKLLRRSMLLLLALSISPGITLEVCSNTILPGAKGDVGVVGDTGEEGRLGKAGPPGHTGLLGENGEKGEAGPTGKSGPAGERGQKGQQGVAGLPGLKGKPGSTCDCGRYRRVVGQMDINIGKLKNTVKFLKNVILGLKETREKFYLLVKEERRHSEAQMNCRLRGGTLAMPENEKGNTLLGAYIRESGLTHVLIGPTPAENSTASRLNCAQMASDGSLSQVECDTAKFFMCEFKKRW